MKTTIRRAFILTVALLLCFICVFTASAEDVRYYISDLGMSISFPSQMSVTTKQTQNAALPPNCYLKAASPDGELEIIICMDETAVYKEIYTSDDLEEVKDALYSIDDEGIYTGSRIANYGGVDFLDLFEIQEDGNTTYYGRMSIALINGMNISIHSQSAGDDFTRDELNIINSSLSSIEFDYIKDNAKKDAVNTFWGWFVAIVIILAVILVLTAYALGSKEKKKLHQKRRSQKRVKNANYDVFETAEANHKKQEQTGTVTGYKSSGDYFERGFDEDIPKSPDEKNLRNTEKKKSPLVHIVSFFKTLSMGFKILFTRLGYFFKNLGRSFSKGKKATKKTKKRSRQARRGASKEYDVFRDK